MFSISKFSLFRVSSQRELIFALLFLELNVIRNVICSLSAFVYFLERRFPRAFSCYIWNHLTLMLLHSLSSRTIQCEIKHFKWSISYSCHVFLYRKGKDYSDECIGLK